MKRVLSCCLIFALLFTLLLTPAQALDSQRYEQIEEMNALGVAGSFTDCIALANTILSEDASFMEAYRYKALSYLYLNDFQKAYDTLLLQLQYNPLDLVALYNAACAASLLGLDEAALDLLETLVNLDTAFRVDIGSDGNFESLYNNPRFQKLMEISIVVGGTLLDLDVAPIITQDRALIPLRAAFESLGADIEWDAAARTVSCVYEGTSMRIAIDSNIARVNGADVEMDVAATIVNGRTLVPIRFIAETLGANVGWDDYSYTVYVNTPAPKGTADLASQKEILTANTAVLAIDGAFVQPYMLGVSEGIICITAKSEDALKAMNALSSEARAQYMADTAYEAYGFVLGCESIYVYFAYEGKIYYTGQFVYDEYGEVLPELTYFENGKPINIVKQYKNGANYKDFYSLPADQRTSTTIDD